MAVEVMAWVFGKSHSRNGARLVLLALADSASADGRNAWPSMAELRRKSGLKSERTVQTALAELVRLGELKIEYNAGPSGCNRYTIIMGPPPPPSATPAESAPPQNPPPAISAGVHAPESPQAGAQDPAISASPADIAPPQNLLHPPAESAPGTVLLPTTTTEDSLRSSSTAPRKRGSTAKRGTRIPDDFALTDAMREWGRANAPGVDGERETRKFVNHFMSAPGSKGVKLDWNRTWQNWILNAADRYAPHPTRTGNGHPTRRATVDERADQADQALAELKADLAAGGTLFGARALAAPPPPLALDMAGAFREIEP